MNTSFSAAMLDLANPEARTWIKEVIKDELISTGRLAGWLTWRGVTLRCRAYDGIDAAEFHNEYPE